MKEKIETITHGLEPIALIIRADYDEPGIQFFTPNSFSHAAGPLHAGGPRCPARQGEGKALCFQQRIHRRPDSALRRTHSPLLYLAKEGLEHEFVEHA
ncbi:MAG: hypothetical protein Q8O04_13070 [Deltaproteobacteria bacterium]|nr:hypothetical protein [Deltaproteobacteria bacterium]